MNKTALFKQKIADVIKSKPLSQSHRTVVKLHADDNVAIACLTLAKGDIVEVDGLKIETLGQIPVGHKMAIRMLSVGEKIIKWGVPVGSVTLTTRAGDHMHTHNIKSDYIPSHSLDAVTDQLNMS